MSENDSRNAPEPHAEERPQGASQDEARGKKPRQQFRREKRDVPEGHLCCGSAGTYNLLQPEIAGRLRDRKLANIATVAPDLVATGNIGCITQLAAGTSLPILHTVELLDWATGGPVPAVLRDVR